MIRLLQFSVLALMMSVFYGCSAGQKSCCATGACPDAGAGRFYEMRTYYTNDGKLDALHARFRDHTNKIFVEKGMTLVGYWTPTEEKDGKGGKLVYILAYPSREARDASWTAFRNDPAWKKAYAESTKDGKLVKKVESVFLEPTDYSPMK